MKIQSTNPWFCSDTHFGHANVIKYCNRPFETPDQMDEVLIENWNSRIGPQDMVFFLGDFSFTKPERTKEVLKELNGNITLIKGNHDKYLKPLYNYFVDVYDLVTIEVPDEDAPQGHQSLVLCHYPMLRWDKQHYGSWNLHGHCHGNLPYDKTVKRLDIGVDVYDYAPVSYQEIKSILSTLPPKGPVFI